MINQSAQLHALVAAFVITAAVSGLVHPHSTTANQTQATPAPSGRAQVQGLPSSCSTAGATADVTFTWQPVAGARQQWLDISALDDGFQKSTTRSAGPLDPGLDSYTWSGLTDNQPWRWRVSALTNEGWVTSPTRIVTPCGANELTSGSRCDGTPAADFRWQPSGGTVYAQWLDVSSFDNGFAPGTFRSVGPLSHEINSLTWEQLPGAALLWRVGSSTPKGWVFTETHSIATCDAPVGFAPNCSCTDGGALVQFRWAPSAASTGGQWVDFSRVLNGFLEGTFVSSAGLAPAAETLVWTYLAPNQTHYYRVNALTANGWRPSVTRSFIPTCPPS